MHLNEMFSDVLVRAGDPNKDNLTLSGITHWLSEGAVKVGQVLFSIDAQKFIKTVTFDTKRGVAEYAIPSGHLQTERLVYNANDSEWRQANEVPVGKIGVITEIEMQRATPFEPKWSEEGSVFTVYPTPTEGVASGVRMTYRRMPPILSLSRRAISKVTTNDGEDNGMSLIDTDYLSKRNGYYDEAEIIIESGEAEEERRVVSSSKGGVLVPVESFSARIIKGVTYSLWDRCILPDQYHRLVVIYATAAAAEQLGNGNLSSAKHKEFLSEMGQIEKHWQRSIRKKLQDSDKSSEVNIS